VTLVDQFVFWIKRSSVVVFGEFTGSGFLELGSILLETRTQESLAKPLRAGEGIELMILLLPYVKVRLFSLLLVLNSKTAILEFKLSPVVVLDLHQLFVQILAHLNMRKRLNRLVSHRQNQVLFCW
jgi:hypothetical protein